MPSQGLSHPESTPPRKRIVRASAAATGAALGSIGGPLTAMAGAVLASEVPDLVADAARLTNTSALMPRELDHRLKTMLHRDLVRSPFANRLGVQPSLVHACREWSATNDALRASHGLASSVALHNLPMAQGGPFVDDQALRVAKTAGRVSIETTAAAAGVVATCQYMRTALGLQIDLDATGHSSRVQVYHALSTTEPDFIVGTLGSMALSTASGKHRYKAIVPLYFGLQAEVTSSRSATFPRAQQPIVYAASGAEEHALRMYGSAVSRTASLVEDSADVLAQIDHLEVGQRAILWEPVLWRTASSHTHKLIPSSVLRSWQGVFVHHKWTRTQESRRFLNAFAQIFTSTYGYLADNQAVAIAALTTLEGYRTRFASSL